MVIEFLSRIFKKAVGAPLVPEVYLGAFGKHPGWNDHIDDQGLETQRLVDLKALLYIEGIASRIDSGVWDKLVPDQQIDHFGHEFLLRARGDLTLGRMWSSTDGKGRARFPMVIAAQVIGASAEWVMHEVEPELERLQVACEEAQTARSVIQAIDSTRRTLREKIAGLPSPAPGMPEVTIPTGLAATLSNDPAFAPDRQGFYRVLYQIERELGSYLIAEDGTARSGDLDPRPQSLRVPGASPTLREAMLRWFRLLLLKLDPGVPFMLLVPMDRAWVDILVGELAGSQLFCLRASPRSIPLASDIPYTLDAEFLDRARAWIERGRAMPPLEVRASSKPRRASEGGRFA